MIYFAALGLALGLGVPIAVIGGGIGQGHAAASTVEAMARQPDMTPVLRTTMILGLAFIESLVIFALLMGFMALSHLPTTQQALNAITTTAQAQK